MRTFVDVAVVCSTIPILDGYVLVVALDLGNVGKAVFRVEKAK